MPCRCSRATTCRRRSSAGCSSLRSSAVATSRGVTARHVRHDAAAAADDRLLHVGRLRRQLLAASRRRAAGPHLLCHRHRHGGVSERRRRAPRGRPRHPAADRRARGLGDADRRSGHRARLRAAVRGGGGAAARTLALAAAMVGIVAGGLIGGPVGDVADRRPAALDAQDGACPRPDQAS